MQSKLQHPVNNMFSFVAKKWAKWYLQKDRLYSYNDLKIEVWTGVFHPGIFRSTTIMGKWLEQINLSNKHVLELGCGSGLLSLVAAKAGATVTAIDINKKAIKNTIANAHKNKLNITAFSSDLFNHVGAEVKYDIVLINPPYFEGEPGNEYEHAWYCGENFSFFKKLFSQVTNRPKGESYYMIISDKCDIRSIRKLAIESHLTLIEVLRKTKMGEVFFVYQIAFN